MADVLVVGAGIVGASVAYAAARRGARVTLVERSAPGSGVTRDSFAWIGASGVPDGPVADLRRSATREYRRLEGELPGVRVRWTGSLSWGGPWTPPGEDQREVGAAEVAALEPQLREPPRRALHLPGDGAVDPVAVTDALVAGAQELGAELRVGTVVRALRLADGRVTGVETSTGPLDASAVVLAAGVGVPALCAPLGVHVPVAPSPAVLLRFAAAGTVVRTLVATPDVEVRQAADGTLLATVEHAGETTPGQLAMTADRVAARLDAMFHGAQDLRLTGAAVGLRPVPADGEPLVGPVPGVAGLHLAVLHSGVSLAAAVGRLAALQVVDGDEVPELLGCRPGRALRPGRPPE